MMLLKRGLSQVRTFPYVSSIHSLVNTRDNAPQWNYE